MCRTKSLSASRPICAIPFLAIPLIGCQDLGNQLYIANTTKLGINASLNSTRQAGSIGIGYDRYFVTWVPRSVDWESLPTAATTGTNQPRDVMSVLACSRLVVNGLSIDDFDESLATGEAARLFAEALDNKSALISKDYFRCFNEDGAFSDSSSTQSGGTGGQS